jgi:3-methyladenine DNA glycosylase AlkC
MLENPIQLASMQKHIGDISGSEQNARIPHMQRFLAMVAYQKLPASHTCEPLSQKEQNAMLGNSHEPARVRPLSSDCCRTKHKGSQGA